MYPDVACPVARCQVLSVWRDPDAPDSIPLVVDCSGRPTATGSPAAAGRTVLASLLVGVGLDNVAVLDKLQPWVDVYHLQQLFAVNVALVQGVVGHVVVQVPYSDRVV